MLEIEVRVKLRSISSQLLHDPRHVCNRCHSIGRRNALQDSKQRATSHQPPPVPLLVTKSSYRPISVMCASFEFLCTFTRNNNATSWTNAFCGKCSNLSSTYTLHSSEYHIFFTKNALLIVTILYLCSTGALAAHILSRKKRAFRSRKYDSQKATHGHTSSQVKKIHGPNVRTCFIAPGTSEA